MPRKPNANEPVLFASDPRAVGGGNQGPWSSCAIFALVNALARESLVKTTAGVDIDVQSGADSIAAMNLKNRHNKYILEEGVDVPYLVDTVAKMCGPDGMVFKTTDQKLVKLTFNQQPEVFDSLDDYWTWATSKGVTSNSMIIVHPVIVAAGGGAGQHGNHGLSATRINKDTVECENSWGGSLQAPVVPGQQWTRILNLYTVRVTQVQVKASTSSKWIVYRG